MPDDEIWPPKPDLPDPLTEYDDVIAAKLAAFPTVHPDQMRFRLIKALRDEGLDVRRAIAVVGSYCDRHGVLVRSKSSRILTWLGFLLPLAMLCYAGILFYWMKRRDEILSLPHHHAAILALDRGVLMITSFAAVLALVNLGIQITRFQQRRKK